MNNFVETLGYTFHTGMVLNLGVLTYDIVNYVFV